MPMKFITRTALKRLAVLFLVLGGLILWFWWTMIRMPGTSYRGPLPPLSDEQTTLRNELRWHVENLAREIGERNVFKSAQLTAAADYIETVLASAGHTVARQTFKA